MKSLSTAAALLAAFLFAPLAFSQTTPNLGLSLPTQGATNWYSAVNGNWNILDTAYGALQQPWQGTWSSIATYSKGQYVIYQGLTYVSTVNQNLNNAPSISSQYWLPATPTGSPNLVMATNAGGSTNGPAGLRALVGADLPLFSSTTQGAVPPYGSNPSYVLTGTGWASISGAFGYTPLNPANNLNDVSSPSTALSNLGGLAKTNNLADVANAATALSNLHGVSTTQTATQTMAGPLNFPQSNGVLFPLAGSPTDICTSIAAEIAALPAAGGTVDARGLSAVSPVSCASNPFATNNAAASPKPVNLLLGPGVINTTVPWLISTDNMSIRGSGRTQTILQYTGTTTITDPGGTNPGGIIEFDTATPASTTIEGVGLSDIFVTGNSHSPYGVLLDGTHKSDLERVSVWNVTNTGIELKFAVANNLVAPHGSSFDSAAAGIPQTVQPANGLGLDGESGSAAATTSSITNPVFEYNSNCGIYLGWTFGNVFISGTSEGNGTNICTMSGGGQYPSGNVFIGTDLESATSSESASIYGYWNKFIGVNFSQNADVYGNYNEIDNGNVQETLTIHSGATRNKIEKINFGGFSDGGTSTQIAHLTNNNPNAYDGAPFESRTTSWDGGSPISTTYDGSDFLTGQYVFTYNTAITISNTALAATHWHAIFIGQWVNSLNGTGMAQIGPLVELSDTNPTAGVGSCTVVFSISSGVFKGTEQSCSTGTTIFNGRIFVVPGTNNSASSWAIQTPDDIAAGNIFAKGGGNIVYRCTTAGTLPVGATTIVPGNCGASVDTGLRVQ